MSFTQNLLEAFEQTFFDLNISSSERKAIRMLLSENELEKVQRDILIGKLYDLAGTRLDKGNNRAVMDWLQKANQILIDGGGEEEKKVEAAEVHFSPGPDCLLAIQDEIRTARERIDICVFTISDNRISDILIERHLQGFPIRVITDNDKLHDEGSDVRMLSDARIPVRIDRTSNHMHHKFAVFDNNRVLTGSYNWTRSAERFNNENILLTSTPKVVRKFQEAFDRLWPMMEDY